MKKLHPRSVWLFFFSIVLRWLFVLIIVGFNAFFVVLGGASSPGGSFRFADFISWSLLILVLSVILSYIWAKLSYHFYRYELTDNGFRKELGVIWKKYVTIPYDRIQNVDIYRGVLARILGLSDLHIQTAGASAQVSRYGSWGIGAEGRLPGLSYEDAEKLRDELIHRARQSGSQSTRRGL